MVKIVERLSLSLLTPESKNNLPSGNTFSSLKLCQINSEDIEKKMEIYLVTCADMTAGPLFPRLCMMNFNTISDFSGMYTV